VTKSVRGGALGSKSKDESEATMVVVNDCEHADLVTASVLRRIWAVVHGCERR
jgi:hypothetical protein